MSDPKKDADRLLWDIAVNKGLLEVCRSRAAAEVRDVNQRYAPQVEKLSRIVSEREKELARLVKKNRGQIMAGKDRTDLPNGSVMLKVERRVKQIKGMLAKLKNAGLTAAIKTSRESVDWDRVNNFDDDTLSTLGTERIKKELVTYELKQPKKISKPQKPAEEPANG